MFVQLKNQGASLSVTCGRSVVSSTNKTDITEMLKVALNIIKPIQTKPSLKN
jgi:hypothetical protein